MKDIYKVLGKIKISEDEMKSMEEETLEMSELERARIKSNVKKNLKGKGKRKWQKQLQVASVLAGVVVAGTAGVGLVNPSYAAEIPIVGDIFRFLDNDRTGIYDLYKENADEINVTKENNGVAITIKDAIFDGRTISYTYEVKVSEDLGEHPLIGVGPDLSIEGYRGGMGGSSKMEKVSEDTYVGQNSYTIDDAYEEINCKVQIKDIVILSETNEKVIKGNWRFDFQLSAVEGNVQHVGKKVEKDGFSIEMESITQSPMSFSLDYTQRVPEDYRGELDSVTTSLKVKDDLGNVYLDEGSSGHSDGEEIAQGIMNVRTTFGKLAEGATKLIVTPTIYCGTNGGGVAIDEAGNETVLEVEQEREDQEIILEPITIELDL